MLLRGFACPVMRDEPFGRRASPEVAPSEMLRPMRLAGGGVAPAGAPCRGRLGRLGPLLAGTPRGSATEPAGLDAPFSSARSRVPRLKPSAARRLPCGSSTRPAVRSKLGLPGKIQLRRA